MLHKICTLKPITLSLKSYYDRVYTAIFTLFSIIFLCIFTASNAYAMSITDLSNNLQKQTMLRAKFEQQRVIKGFNKPLISKGQLVTHKDKGIIWIQESPINMHYIITDEKIVTFVNKDELTILKASDNPQMFYFSSLLKNIISANTKVLYESFEVNFTSDKDTWILDLRPKVAPLDKIFTKFILKGDNFVRSIELLDKENDSTFIKFIESTDKNIVLNDNEIALFAL